MGALSWPEEALRANIIAQVSLALNRIWTEWYPSRGYSFNITGSPGYDQAYVNGRTVFAVMERADRRTVQYLCPAQRRRRTVLYRILRRQDRDLPRHEAVGHGGRAREA
mgnify:CR=1 FL=1